MGESIPLSQKEIDSSEMIPDDILKYAASIGANIERGLRLINNVFNNSNLVNIEEMVGLFERIRDKKQLTQKDMFILIYMSVRALRGVKFSGCTLGYKGGFTNVDFSDSDFTDADVVGTKFYGSNLQRAHMERLRIGDDTVEIMDDILELPEKNPWGTKISLNIEHDCAKCEFYNASILDHPEFAPGSIEYSEPTNYRRGIVIMYGNELIGLMKLKGVRTFLAARTVCDTKGNTIFWKGMVYALDPVLRTYLEEASEEHRKSNSWRRIDISTIRKQMLAPYISHNNLRFITDARLYPVLDELCKNMREGNEPCVTIHEKTPWMNIARKIASRLLTN